MKEYKTDLITTAMNFEYFLSKINDTDLQYDPFPHLWIERNALDPWCHTEMVKNWPGKMPEASEHSRQVDLFVDPGIERFADGKLHFEKHIPEEICWFWKQFAFYLDSDEFKSALISKFDLSIGIDEVYIAARVCEDLEGSGLGPHTDRIDKLVSMLLYVDHNPDACPTMLLAPKDPNFKASSQHFTMHDFDIVKPIPYRENSMMAWSVGDDSWHSFNQLEPTIRRSIKIFLQSKSGIKAAQKVIKDTKKNTNDWKTY